jgi:microsomal prostaglandin-E synthase 1
LEKDHRNALETILPFLAIAFLAAMSGAVTYEAVLWLFVPFTVVRVLHTVGYAFRLQPWRSILLGIGDTTLLFTTTLLLRAAM